MTALRMSRLSGIDNACLIIMSDYVQAPTWPTCSPRCLRSTRTSVSRRSRSSRSCATLLGRCPRRCSCTSSCHAQGAAGGRAPPAVHALHGLLFRQARPVPGRGPGRGHQPGVPRGFAPHGLLHDLGARRASQARPHLGAAAPRHAPLLEVCDSLGVVPLSRVCWQAVQYRW